MNNTEITIHIPVMKITAFMFRQFASALGTWRATFPQAIPFREANPYGT